MINIPVFRLFVLSFDFLFHWLSSKKHFNTRFLVDAVVVRSFLFNIPNASILTFSRIYDNLLLRTKQKMMNMKNKKKKKKTTNEKQEDNEERDKSKILR